MSVVKSLPALLGGEWRYTGRAWECSDGRLVFKTLRGDGLPGAHYYMYQHEKLLLTTIHVCWGKSCSLTGKGTKFGNMLGQRTFGMYTPNRSPEKPAEK